MQDGIFDTQKTSGAHWCLWEVDEDGTVIAEKVFPKETFPAFDMLLTLGNYIQENNITACDLLEATKQFVKEKR